MSPLTAIREPSLGVKLVDLARSLNERTPVRPVSVYGASKAACESLIHAYSKLYGIKAVILKYAKRRWP
jgi:nucleoside-diphosphate-sugar epimerase